MALQLNPSKEKKDSDTKLYIGNCKESDGSKPVSDKDLKGIGAEFDDLPF